MAGPVSQGILAGEGQVMGFLCCGSATLEYIIPGLAPTLLTFCKA